jgi:hypothetical protein
MPDPATPIEISDIGDDIAAELNDILSMAAPIPIIGVVDDLGAALSSAVNMIAGIVAKPGDNVGIVISSDVNGLFTFRGVGLKDKLALQEAIIADGYVYKDRPIYLIVISQSGNR